MDLPRPDGRSDALPWQERQRRMRETAILDAAATLLAERGYAATSMDEIAAHVGISKPTLYQHFPSKDAVAVAVMLHRLGHTQADLARAERAVDEGERARPQLERVLRDALARRSGAWSTRVELPRSVVENAPEVDAARREVWTRIGALVDQAKAEGDCRADAPTPVIARHLAGLFRGDYSDLVDQGAPPEALAATFVSLVFEGLAPRELAPREATASPEMEARLATDAPGPRLGVRRVARRASMLFALAAGAHAVVPVMAHAQQAPVTPAAEPLPATLPATKSIDDPPAGPPVVPPLDSKAPLGAPSTAARVIGPQPLFPQRVPSQTEIIPGVPTQAGGRAPGAPATPAGLAGRALTLADVLDASLRANPSTFAAVASAQSSRAQYLSARAAAFPVLSFNPGITRSQSLGLAGGGITTGTLPGNTGGTGTGGTGTGTTGTGGTGTGGTGTGSTGTGGTGTGTSGTGSTGTGTTGTSTATTVAGTGLTQRTSFTPAIGLTFLAFDFGGRAGQIGSARETANAAGATLDATIVNTLLQAEQAYFGYQSARDVVEASQQNLQTAQASRDASVALFRAGLATVADTLQAATALAQARVNLLNARQSLSQSRDTLATVINARSDVPFTVATERAPTGSAATSVTALLTARVDTLVAHAVRTRPDVDAMRDQALAAQQQVRTARSALLPAVTVTGTAGYNQIYGGVQTINGMTYNIQVGLSVPVFDGGARRASLQAANASADAARSRADAMTTQAVNQVVSSAEVLRESADRLAANETLLATAERNAQVAAGRYQAGVGTIVDLLNAQTTLATARSQLAQARWAWATSLAQLARNAGILGLRGELPAVAAPAVPASTPLSTTSDASR